MNGVAGGGISLTPKSRLRTAQEVSIGRDDAGLQLTLKSVNGTTTDSENGFDSVQDRNIFAYCAGPAVILSQVEEDFQVAQRLFRAKPNAASVNAASSFYNGSTPPTTPSKMRYSSSLRDGGIGSGVYNLSEYGQESPGTGKAASWNREATCISLSRNGRFVAVGETGYNPRALIFSAAPEHASDSALSILTDHSFGIRSIAFSKDSRWLCSLGNAFDGFLLLYTVNAKTGVTKLHSSNKCSNVTRIAWMGNSVVSVGPRHVKVWRVGHPQTASPLKSRFDLDNSINMSSGSPGPKTFNGRNCLLGSLLDATFTCVVPLSDDKAIVCTNQGDLCLLDDEGRIQRLERIAKVEFEVHCAYHDEHRGLLWVGGSARSVQAFKINPQKSTRDLLSLSDCGRTHVQSSNYESSVDDRIFALGGARDSIILSDSQRHVALKRVDRIDASHRLGADYKYLPAHEKAVLGVCDLSQDLRWHGFDFLTYSSNGNVLFWQSTGVCAGQARVLLDQMLDFNAEDVNELKALRVSTDDDFLITGDKRGVLRISDRSGQSITFVQAHHSDINGIAVMKDLIATCSRDRTIQVFRKTMKDLDLIQTIDDHAAAIGDVLFTDDGNCLLSMSSDRTIIVRKVVQDENLAMAFLCVRVITLKASPACFGLSETETGIIMVSTMDRQVQRIDIRSGRVLSAFKAADPSTGDTVLLTSLEVRKFGEGADERNLLVAASSADRAVRIHDCSNGKLIFKEQGQTTLSSVRMLSREVDDPTSRMLVSCGLDGTIFMWSVGYSKQAAGSPLRAESPLRQTPASNSVQRKTLTRAEITKFQKSLDVGEEGASPPRSPSPSRIRKKVSRSSMVDLRRASLAPSSNNNTGAQHEKLVERSKERLSDVYGARSRDQLKSRRPSLDPRRRSKSAANLNDLNESAEQLRTSLKVFRERVEASLSDKLDPSTALEVERELHLALATISEKKKKTSPKAEKIANDSIDVYLAKMIDERLALRSKTDPLPNGQTGVITEEPTSEEVFGRSRQKAVTGLETLLET